MGSGRRADDSRSFARLQQRQSHIRRGFRRAWFFLRPPCEKCSSIVMDVAVVGHECPDGGLVDIGGAILRLNPLSHESRIAIHHCTISRDVTKAVNGTTVLCTEMYITGSVY